jgi:segregation and condensation protein B
MHNTEGELKHKPPEPSADADTGAQDELSGKLPTDDADVAGYEATETIGDEAAMVLDPVLRLADEPAEFSDEAEPLPADVGEVDGPVVRAEGDDDADTDTLEAPEGTGEQEITTERVVEAVLFASDAPLPLSKIVSVVGVGSARDIRNHIKSLNERYEKTGASFRIEQIASGYQILTLPTYNTWIRRLKQTNKDNKLSQAAMETLAVVAYKQPVVRADIEAIRGVAAGEMLNRLRELGLIKIVGRAEDVGRPMLYGTTKRFLEVFGLSGIEDLPAVEEMQSGE